MNFPYSTKLQKRFLSLRYIGNFTKEEAREKGVRLAFGQEEKSVAISLLVDPEDGIIIDAAFQALGSPVLLACADVACELVMRKNYLQARQLTASHIEQALRDHPSIPAFPQIKHADLNLLLFALDDALLTCMDIPVDVVTTPFSFDETEATPHPNWESLTKDEKLTLIEQLLDVEIRPYIAMDGGGVAIKEFVDEKELIITYNGACTSCYAATGSTLTAIQQLLSSKLHPSLIVIPDASVLASE